MSLTKSLFFKDIVICVSLGVANPDPHRYLHGKTNSNFFIINAFIKMVDK